MRTAAKYNTHAMTMLHEMRFTFLSGYQQSLEEQTPWVTNLILDEDEDPSDPWIHQYDPDLDFMFGKNGLPQTIWEGHKIFKSLQTLPEPLHQPLIEYFNSEVERINHEQMEALEKIRAMQSPRSKNSQSNEQAFNTGADEYVYKSAEELNLDQG